MLHQQKSAPMTAAERQAICRAKKKAIKDGTYNPDPHLLGYLPGHLVHGTPEMREAERALFAARGIRQLPPPQTTAIEKAKPSSSDSTESTPALATPDIDPTADQILSSLPPAVAKRLRTLISKHQSGKSLTADELAEARGLLDIAEYFSIQRMRKQLAA